MLEFCKIHGYSALTSSSSNTIIIRLVLD